MQSASAWAPPPPSAGTWQPKGYGRGRNRATWAQVAVGLATAAMIISAVLLIGGIGLPDKIEAGTATDTEINEWIRSLDTVSNGTTLLQVLGAICVLTWLYRAVANVPALGRGATRWSPGQSVVWWFVPVAFLVMPWVVVRDLWRRMSPAGVTAGSAIVGTWWLLYLGGSIAGRAVETVYRNASTADEFKGALIMTASAIGAVAVSGVLLIQIIRTVEAHADELARHVPAVPAAPAASPGIPWRAAAPPPPPPPGPTGAAFCPRCATRRLPGARYCASCAFDFATAESAGS